MTSFLAQCMAAARNTTTVNNSQGDARVNCASKANSSEIDVAVKFEKPR